LGILIGPFSPIPKRPFRTPDRAFFLAGPERRADSKFLHADSCGLHRVSTNSAINISAT